MVSHRHSIPPHMYQNIKGRLAAYLSESRRPLASLLFIAPLLIAYELGVLVIPSTIRNGADAWLRQLLEALGFSGYFLLPCLSVAMLLGWHHMLRERWHVGRLALVGMASESIVLALILVGMARLHGVFLSIGGSLDLAAGAQPGLRYIEILGQIVAFCGAGIYEEMLFRLMLIPSLAWLATLARLAGRSRTTLAVVGSSLLFSLAHFVGPAGDAWELDTFLFRLSAGIFFGLLFVYRGFGIAAGTHAFYDVLVGVRWT